MWNLFKKNRPIEYRVKETTLIKKHFGFLFEQGFSIIHTEPPESFNNWLIDLQSDFLRIQFAEDRGELIIRLGPQKATTGWHGSHLWQFQILIFYLTKNFEVSKKHLFTKKMDEAATYFQEYYPKIQEIMKSESFNELEANLEKSRSILLQLKLEEM